MLAEQPFLVPMPPAPRDLAENRRVEETRRRRRMLYGQWRSDLEKRLLRDLGGIRKEAWGEPDMSSNVFRASVGALAVLYDEAPLVHHDEPDAQDLSKLVAKAGLWSLMQRHQRDTIGLREMLMAVDARLVGDVAQLIYRPVYPDMVHVEVDPVDPGRPVQVDELRLRRHPKTGRPEWAYECWSIRDPLKPEYFWRDPDGRRVGEEPWPDRFRRADTTPVLPFVLRHAAVTGETWDPFELIELVEGSLNCAVKWTFFGHVVRNASWPQRYAAGVTVPSAGSEGESEGTKRDAVVADPATVILFEATEDGGQPMIGQWQPGADPKVIEEAVSMYERRVAAYAGISPSDVQRVAGDPRSGFAIALNRDAQRDAQRRFEPVSRPPDEEMMALSAIIANRVAGTDYPEDGYRVAYQGLAPSPEEQKANREKADWDIAHDQISPIDVYVREHPGATDADAIAAIVKARIDRLTLEQRIREEAAILGLDLPAPPPAQKPAQKPAEPPKPVPQP